MDGFLHSMPPFFGKKKKKKRICPSLYFSGPGTSSGGTRQQTDGEPLPQTLLRTGLLSPALFLGLCYLKKEHSEQPPGGPAAPDFKVLKIQIPIFWRPRF